MPNCPGELITAGLDKLAERLKKYYDRGARFAKWRAVIDIGAHVPTMTAIENVALPLEFAGRPDPFATATRMLGDVGLGHRLTHFPAQLSGGEQQRVALARALAPMPKLLLADEPTGNLDTTTGAQIIELMFEMKRTTGATLVLITHDLSLAERCDRIIRMHDGRIVGAASDAAVVAA